MEDEPITVCGGSFINIWKCDKHSNEVWDYHQPDKPICIPCQVLKLRAENERLTNKLNKDSQNFEILCLREMEKRHYAIVARVEDVEGMAKILRTPDSEHSVDPIRRRIDPYKVYARAVRDYLMNESATP